MKILNKKNPYRILSGLILATLVVLTGQSAYADADIQPVTFLDSPDPVPASGLVDYLIIVQNNDPDDPALNPELTVTVPNGFFFTSADDLECDYTGLIPSDGTGLVTCDWSSSLVLSRTVNLRYTASSTVGTFEVTATTSADNDSNPSNNIERNITDVEESSDLELVSKTANPNPVEAGGIVTYEFVVTNNGPYVSQNLVLSDTLPTGLSFVADNASPSAGDDAAWNCTAAGQDVSCSRDSLAIGVTSTFFFRVKATSATVGSLSNLASVSSDSPEPNPDNNTVTEDIEIIAGTDMSIVKVVDTDPVIGGQPVQYTLTVTNEGPMMADNVEVIDTLPASYGDIAIVSITPPITPPAADWVCDSPPIAGPIVTCTILSMAAGQSFDIVIQATPPVVGATENNQNTATVSTDTADPIPENDTATVGYDVRPDTADLSLNKNKYPVPFIPGSPLVVAQGSNMTSVISVQNLGPRDADEVQVVEVLDPGETFVSVSGNWSCDPLVGGNPGGTLTCDYNAEPLAAGATATDLTIITTATNTGLLTNTACTGGSGGSIAPSAGDSLTANNCNTGEVLSTAASADLEVTKTADDTDIDATENSFSYSVTIENLGDDTAEDVIFDDVIPQYIGTGPGGRPATTLTPVTDQGSCTISGAAVQCDLGDIASGDTVTVTITVARPMRDGTRTNTASAFSTLTGDPVRGNNEDDAVVTVAPETDIEVTDKQVAYANSTDPIIAETIATYTINVRNNGPSTATDVVLDDLFSGEGFEFISSSVAGGGSCTWSAPNLSCDLQSMNANSTKAVTIRTRPDHLSSPSTIPWPIDNTATISMNPAITDSDLTNNSKSLTLLVRNGEADLAVEKNESPLFVEPLGYDPAPATGKGFIVYEIVVSNRGPSLANGVVFTDNVLTVTPLQGPTPQRLKFVRDTENSDGTAGSPTICSNIGVEFPLNGGPDINCTLPNPLEAGDSYTRYLVFEVLTAPNPLTGDSYNNSVTVTAEEPDLNPANDTEDENTTVRTIADLGIVKSSTKTTANPNRVEVEEGFNFSLAITNHGPGISPGATVVDNLPSGMVLTGPITVPTSPNGNPDGITWICTGGIDDTAFSCTLGQMADAQTLTLTVPVKMTSYPSGGTITNTATVTGLAPEPADDTINPNTDSHTVGVLEPAVIGNRVWLDRDADGIQDGGEPGLDGVTVNLLDNSNNVIATTTTANGGLYSFTINSAGSYKVEFEKLNGDLASPADAGTNDSIDSDAALSDGRTGLITVNYGDMNNTIDAGFYELLSVGDRVWLDDNANGIQDSGEPSLAGVTVELLDDGLSVINTATTDASGNFFFTNLEPSQYFIQITPPAWVGYLASPVQQGNSNTNNNSDSNIATIPADNVFRSGAVTLSSRSEPSNDGDGNNSNLTVDFGLVTPASVGNSVWLDENSNGIKDAGEPGIANVTVLLKDSDGNIIDSRLTDTDGGYLFIGVAPGDYFIEVDGTTLPAGLSQTTNYPNPGADLFNQNQSIGDGYGVTLTSGGENLTADFGYNWSPTTDVTDGENDGAIGDRVWIDSNGNGVQDASEPGVAGVELTLLSAGPDGEFFTGDDVAEATVVTDAAGNYIFDDVTAGVYAIEVTDDSGASHDILNGTDYVQSGDPDHFAQNSSGAPAGTAGDNRSTQPIALGPGDSYLNVDFGYQPQSGTPVYSIGDTVWLDINGDGIEDAGETGIAGVTVALQNGSGDYIANTSTAGDGTYLFTGLPDGDYTIVITDTDNVLAGLVPTYDSDSATSPPPDGMSATTLAGADDLDQDFGYTPINPGLGTGAIGDTIFLDRDDSGTFEFGEGLEGIRVILKNSSGDVLAATKTDENGNYIFTGLAGGDYIIEVDTASLPPGLDNTVDPQDDGNSTSAVTIAVGEVNLDQDFGYLAVTPNTIGNFVWLDTNADGVYQPNGLDGVNGTSDDETPISGVSIELYNDLNGNDLLDPNEPLIGTAVTDGNGNYLFAGLPDGDYLVNVSDSANILEGHFHSLGVAGNNNNSQSDYYAVSVSGGVSELSADFGYYYAPGSLGNLVWQDVDVNGLYESATDSPLAGVTVYLDIEYPDGTTITLQSVTDADGLYSFTNLLLDENYTGIGSSYGTGGDEPSHIIRIDDTTLPVGLAAVYPTRERNTDSTTVGGAAADNEDADNGSDDPEGEPGFPPQGSVDQTNDFAFFVPGSIGDTIWNDQNNDGTFDTGEGLNGITVSLTPPADVNLGSGLGVTVTTVTNTSGGYLFPNLPPGAYSVAVVESSLPTFLQGRNTVDPDGGNNSTATPTIAIGEDNLDQDFAYFIPSSIGDYVFDDTNGNGIQDGSESGHQGVTVQLLDGSGNPVENPILPGVDYIVQTDANGAYLFENLLPGNYQVRFIPPAGNSFTLPNTGGDDGLDSDPPASGPSTGLVSVSLGPNDFNQTIDAGLVGPAINVEKSTNGTDADTTPGVSLDVGDSITWSYVVTNTGNVSLVSVSVSDDKLGSISCPQSTLGVGATMTCTASGTAVAGQYANIGSVIGSPPTGPAVLDSDPSHYLAGSTSAAIDIEKATNGVDADTGTGPVISAGDTVTWSYVVTNTGSVTLNSISVTDDIIGAISCPQSTLDAGQTMTCTATAAATAGQYTNIGTVIGSPLSGPDVSDSDPSHYFGSTIGVGFAAVDLEKSTNGVDADVSPGPNAEIGFPVTWTYLVTNTGDVDLTNVTITDDQLTDTSISCPNDGNTDNSIVLLAVGDSATCTATATATAGQYSNTGSVIGTPPTGPDVFDNDPSHYFGTIGSIDIEKFTNGRDADTEPGPVIQVEKEVLWSYVVTNTGPFPLDNVVVTDDQGVSVTCPQNMLAVSESMTCSGDGIAVEGQYENIGSVTATTPNNVLVSDTDPSHYLGTTFFWQLVIPAIVNGCPSVPDYCYMVADGDNQGSNNSALIKYDFPTQTLELVNRLGAANIEAITYSLDGKIIYAADDGIFGIIDDTPGISRSFVPIDARGVGSGRGAFGTISMSDIDGLSFDPTTKILYATMRYGDGRAADGDQDLLFQINPKTGRIVKNAFGTGIDYVVIMTAAIGASDIDDIEVDFDGTLYGIAGNSGSGGDRLIIIDKKNGKTQDFGPLQQNGKPVQDMEGLTLFNRNDLYGTTGLEFDREGTDNTLYRIEKKSGESVPIIKLDQNFNGYRPRDFESITCFPVCK